uniref:Uncharacterized protein n=1 Tax=Peronospora matthiolae TaxID=2874970 RepID=A0AAV1T8W6_9STRA
MVAEGGNKHVTSVRCSFYAFFGRTQVKAGHEHAGKKRQRLSKRHHVLDVIRAAELPQSPRNAHLDFASDLIMFGVSAFIVDVIIADLLFWPNEMLADFSDDGDEDNSCAVATIAIKAAAKAKLFVKDKSNVASAMQYTKERCDLSKLGSIQIPIVGLYLCAVIAFALQRIADLCFDESVYALSLDGDGITQCVQHFFDRLLRVFYRGVMPNLHLVAVLQFGRHMPLNHFKILLKFLDALYGIWRRKPINVGTEGEAAMVRRLNGLVARMSCEAEHHILRIWCPPHQIDVVVKDGAKMVYDGEWSNQTWSLPVCLRSKANMITSMNAECSKKTNSWVSLGVLLEFIRQYRRIIIKRVTANASYKLPSAQ